MSANKNKYLIILAGPTAVGKTKASIHLALRYDCEIFSCDSRQLYKEMKIGTAPPSTEELQQVPHHFIASHSIHKPFTVSDYEKEADLALYNYFKTNSTAILTGGTGLYIKALLEGLDDFPDVPDTIIDQLEADLKEKGLPHMVDRLKTHDPTTAEIIDLQNSRRVLRALSVCLAEGKPYSSYLRKKKKSLPYKPVLICLYDDREKLYDRINHRVDIMVENGLVAEAKALFPHRHLKALQTVGYSELFDHFEGDSSLEEAISLIKRNSRRYAKRQMTWFRNQENFKMIHVTDLEELENYVAEAMTSSTSDTNL